MPSIFDIVQTDQADENTTIVEGVKSVVVVYEELIASNVTHKLSFSGGLYLSHILAKLQQAIAERGGLSEEDMEDDDVLATVASVLEDKEVSYLYGMYLIS